MMAVRIGWFQIGLKVGVWEESDSRIWRFFYQGLTPEDTALAALIEKIRRTAPGSR